MDYEKKYKETLERARKLQENSNGMILRKWLWNIFPELKESKDERIRNVIRGWIYTRPASFFDNGISKEEMLAWLEKQGKQKPQGKSALEAITEEKVDNSNKIEKPKFHEGDWIIQGCNILKIKCVGNTHYCYETVGGYVDDMLVSEIDSLYHLWTIQDAKDGDVLYSIDSRQPFIYKERPQFSQAIGYCCINEFGEFAIWNTSKCVICTDKYIPATKEQRDTLFAKMKEAGYEFDFEKKELKKIEQSELAESEDERIKKDIISHLQYEYVVKKNVSDVEYDKWIAWLEKQGDITKLSEEEQNKFAKGVLTSCALSFINYLDAHKYEGKMCVSNRECEDIENAFHNAMWDRLHRYYCKYIEKQGEK